MASTTPRATATPIAIINIHTAAAETEKKSYYLGRIYAKRVEDVLNGEQGKFFFNFFHYDQKGMKIGHDLIFADNRIEYVQLGNIH